MKRYRIRVDVVVTAPDGDDVSVGAYLDGALSYMCEVSDEQRRIEGYQIHTAEAVTP